jgi:hypothetical protein
MWDLCGGGWGRRGSGGDMGPAPPPPPTHVWRGVGVAGLGGGVGAWRGGMCGAGWGEGWVPHPIPTPPRLSGSWDVICNGVSVWHAVTRRLAGIIVRTRIGCPPAHTHPPVPIPPLIPPPGGHRCSQSFATFLYHLIDTGVQAVGYSSYLYPRCRHVPQPV